MSLSYFTQLGPVWSVVSVLLIIFLLLLLQDRGSNVSVTQSDSQGHPHHTQANPSIFFHRNLSNFLQLAINIAHF